MNAPGQLQQRYLSRTRTNHGQALVEMAIVIMIMLTITVAAIDFGIYMFRYVQAANCVREAARRAVVRDPSAANPPYCVDAALPAPTLSPAGYLTAAQGTEVTASISVPYDWLALDTFIPGLTGSINAHTSMRMEGQVVT
jgi:hypothetical protein